MSTVISPHAAEQRTNINQVTRSPSTREALTALLTAAGEAQSDCRANVAGAHIVAGESAAEYLSAAMAGITADHGKACLAHVDCIIDASQDGQSRNARRQQIRQQVCAAHLVTLIPSVADLPWAHVLAIIGAKIVTFDQERGTADCSHPEWLPSVRGIVADHLRSPMSRDALRDALASVTGKKTSAQKKADEKAAIESALAQETALRLALASGELAPEQKAAILRQYPHLDPSQVNPAAVTQALAAVNALRDTASYVEALAQLIAATPDDTLALAMDRATALAQEKAEQPTSN